MSDNINRWHKVCMQAGRARSLTPVGEEAVIMVSLKEAQQHCQDEHDDEDGEGNVSQVRQGLLKGARHSSNPGLDVPAIDSKMCHHSNTEGWSIAAKHEGGLSQQDGTWLGGLVNYAAVSRGGAVGCKHELHHFVISQGKWSQALCTLPGIVQHCQHAGVDGSRLCLSIDTCALLLPAQPETRQGRRGRPSAGRHCALSCL